MEIGSVVFGPQQTAEEAARRLWDMRAQSLIVQPAQDVRPCNCIGPQPGERKCPCQLRAEAEQGERMVREGVTINGRRYRLIPDDKQ